MGTFIQKRTDMSFDAVYSALAPRLHSEGFRLMTDIKAQNETKDRNTIGLLRFVIFQSRLNKVLSQPSGAVGDPMMRISSSVTLRERADGGTDVVGYAPTLSAAAEREARDKAAQGAAELKEKLEADLEREAAGG